MIPRSYSATAPITWKIRRPAGEVVSNAGSRTDTRSTPQRPRSSTRETSPLSVRPNHYQGLTNLGVAYQELGQYQKALRCYHRARVLNPRDWMVLRNLGSIHLTLARRALTADKPARELLLEARRFFKGALHYNAAEEDARVGLERVEGLLKVLDTR